MEAGRLPIARARFPEWAADEASAAQRVRESVVTGDVHAGAKAMADWIDAQALMLVMLSIEDDRIGHS